MVQALFSTCQKTLSYYTCEPEQDGYCIAILSGSDSGYCPLRASWFQTFERLTTGRHFYFPEMSNFVNPPSELGFTFGKDVPKPESLKVLLKKIREVLKERG